MLGENELIREQKFNLLSSHFADMSFDSHSVAASSSATSQLKHFSPRRMSNQSSEKDWRDQEKKKSREAAADEEQEEEDDG